MDILAAIYVLLIVKAIVMVASLLARVSVIQIAGIHVGIIVLLLPVFHLHN